MSAEVVCRDYKLTKVLYIIYSTVSVQQTNLLPANASQIKPFSTKVYITLYWTTSQYVSCYIWLCNHCTIPVLYSAFGVGCSDKTFAISNQLSPMW